MISFSLPPVVRQCIFVIAANLSGLGVGLCLGWSSPVLMKLEDRNSTVLSRPITDEEATWLVSVTPLVCFVFLLIGPSVFDRIGSRYTFSFVYIPKLIACLLFIFGTEFWAVMVGRVFEGISMAFNYVILSTYTAEIADKHIRGSLGTIIQTARSVGIVGMLGIGPFLSYMDLHIAYIGVTVISALPIAFLPESPYFLYSKGKLEESEKVLNSLRRTTQEVQEELQMFAKTKNKDKLDFHQLLRNKPFLKALGISLFLSVVGPLTGFNFVVFYLQNVMEAAGSSISPEVTSVVVGIVQLVACFPPIFFIDRYGRKIIMTITMLLMGLGMFGLGVFFWCKESGYQITSFLDILPILSACIVNVAIAGYGSILFILVPELFDGPQRALGVSISCLAMSVGIFAVTKSYSAFVTYIGYAGSFWIFAVISVIFAVFSILCIPETKGKRFDEIQEDLEGKSRDRNQN